jgi:sugar phosphate isomerase/epimerase
MDPEKDRMNSPLPRRNFLSILMGIPFLRVLTWEAGMFPGRAKKFIPNPSGLKTSLNAYSFNAPLLAGTMTLDNLLDFCSVSGFQGVDITAYYFKGYPEVPSDEHLYQIKRKAVRLGLEISGTGVRNDFTIADPVKRKSEVALVKAWIESAAKLGAPVIRIFAGNQKNDGIANEKVLEWMLEDIRTCADYGRQHGVIVGLQNHNDFIQTASDAVQILEKIHSDWLGLILDTGSFRVLDPYEEIQRAAPHAVNWQIKEKVFSHGAEQDLDFDRLMEIIRVSGYRGFLPIETLGEGDPSARVIAMLAKLKTEISRNDH